MAGGGTGGHVFPMIAVADALKRLRPDLDLGFVGTEKGLETRLVPERGYPLRLVKVLPLRGGGMRGALSGAVQAGRATWAERRLLAEFAPRAVFSIGGYAAGPVALAARSLGILVALMEPNSVMGLANRLMAPFVQRAYTAFAAVERHFAKNVVLRAGVPIREGFGPREYRPGTPPHVLVLGGSQGAKSLNETLPEAFARLPFPVNVTHQCGAAHAASVEGLYGSQSHRIEAKVVPFIDDVPGALAVSDLVVSRSGASAVSEICAVGRPSLLLPYPYAAGDHQRANAEALVARGAAVCLPSSEVSVGRLQSELTALLSDVPRLTRMAKAARSLGKPDAARTIAADLLALAGLGPAVETNPGGVTALRALDAEVH